ncbi:hypothetical protein EX30DRAFT_351546 [Ascodesmis nigricans]|uniref:Uncharacterized protein n=1 Tax=Ascodesmis nigricans TaxID=341454 RepID=A0A4S2MLG4_9PEZI|nr:hypothetical protein EX30DRAFT_351546 [Ascodesmis nigricans]
MAEFMLDPASFDSEKDEQTSGSGSSGESAAYERGSETCFWFPPLSSPRRLDPSTRAQETHFGLCSPPCMVKPCATPHGSFLAAMTLTHVIAITLCLWSDYGLEYEQAASTPQLKKDSAARMPGPTIRTITITTTAPQNAPESPGFTMPPLEYRRPVNAATREHGTKAAVQEFWTRSWS